MNTDQLAYIIEIAKTKSMAEAAKNLHISQSGLSQSIHQIEKELGTTLFQRSRAGSLPTAEGKKVIKLAEEILGMIHQVKSETAAQKQILNGLLKLSVVPTTSIYLFRMLMVFKKDFPRLTINFKEQSSEDIILEVKERKIDFGIVTLNEEAPHLKDDELTFDHLLQGKVKVYVSKRSPLASKEFLTVEDLSKLPTILFQCGTIIRIVEELNQSLHPLNIIMTTNSSDIVKQAVAANEAISIALHFDFNDHYIQSGDIVILELRGLDMSTELLGCVRRKDRPLTDIAKKFIKRLEHSLIHREF